MNNLIPVNNISPFGVEDDRAEAGFAENLENTFWILHNGKLHCGGNLVAHPEFRHSNGLFSTMKPQGHIYATKYHLHTSETQIRRLQEIFLPSNRHPYQMSADPQIAIGYFLKLNLAGVVRNIGVLLEDCCWENFSWNQNPSRKEWFACLIALHTTHYRMSYIDDSIYDDPNLQIKSFIHYNPLGINYRKGDIERAKELNKPKMRLK